MKMLYLVLNTEAGKCDKSLEIVVANSEEGALELAINHEWGEDRGSIRLRTYCIGTASNKLRVGDVIVEVWEGDYINGETCRNKIKNLLKERFSVSNSNNLPGQMVFEDFE